MTEQSDGMSVNRRIFLKASGLTAAGAVVGSALFDRAGVSEAEAAAGALRVGVDPDAADDTVSIVYSVCLGCHSACGIKCQVDNGILIKIDGNPYHPNNAEWFESDMTTRSAGGASHGERLDYGADPSDTNTRRKRGRNCAKGQANIETLYNPYRIRDPLKKVGNRDSRAWEVVSWDTALEDIRAKLQPEFDNYAAPMGPTAEGITYNRGSQVAFSPGRYEHGQKEFTDRFWGKGFGTVNSRWDHTSICEATHHSVNKLMNSKGANKWWPEVDNCEYLLLIGANPLEANFPMITYARRIARALKRSNFKLAVVDPRLSKTAAKAHRWYPVKPGTDASFVMGIIREILERNYFDAPYHEAANEAAITTLGDNTYTSSTHMVITEIVDGAGTAINPTTAEPGGAPNLYVGMFLRDGHINGAGVNQAFPAASVGGAAPTTFDPAGADVTGTLLPGEFTVVLDAATYNGGTPLSAKVKTTFQLLREKAFSNTLDTWATTSGLGTSDLIEIAYDLTHTNPSPAVGRPGKRAAVQYYRGVCKHANGGKSSQAVMALNVLLGSFGWMGGLSVGGGHWHEVDAKTGRGASTTAALKTTPGGGDHSASGPPVHRALKNKGSIAAGTLPSKASYPTQRPWFPLAMEGNYQEALSSLGDRYPYPIQALFTYWNDWAYSTPAGKGIANTVLTDRAKLPFYVSFDIDFGETSQLADYLLPDSTVLERWSTPHVAPTVLSKTSGFRQPVVGKVFNQATQRYVDIGDYFKSGTTFAHYVNVPVTGAAQTIDLAALTPAEPGMVPGSLKILEPGLWTSQAVAAAGDYLEVTATTFDIQAYAAGTVKVSYSVSTATPQDAYHEQLAELIEDLGAGDPAWTSTPYYIPLLPNTRVIEDIFVELGLRLGTNSALWPALTPFSPANPATWTGQASGFAGIGNDTDDLGGLEEWDPVSAWPPVVKRKPFFKSWDWWRSVLANYYGEADDAALVPAFPVVSAQMTARELNVEMAKIMARGGVFEDDIDVGSVDTRWDTTTGKLKNQKMSMWSIYVESMAVVPDPMQPAGVAWPSTHPIGGYNVPHGGLGQPPITDAGLPDQVEVRRADGSLVPDSATEYPFALITYKQAYHSMARTFSQRTLQALQPENFLEMNAGDAAALGIKTGDTVRAESATSAAAGVFVEGLALATQRMRPGVVAIAHSFGHWEMSSRPQTLGGSLTGHDPGRGKGIPANPIMREDDSLAAAVPGTTPVALQDKIGGSAAFLDTKIKVTRVQS